MSKFPMIKNQKSLLLVLLIVTFLAAGCGKKQEGQQNQPVVNTQTQNTVQEKKIKATQIIYENGTNVTTNLEQPENSNALDALRVAALIETKNFGSAGEFVESIDGIKPDSKHFWAFYVNGKQSNVGADSYKIKEGDKIEWKLEAIK